MHVYKFVWADRNQSHTEWVGTKRELSARKASVRKLATKRPYDQIEPIFSGLVEVPMAKAPLIKWLNEYAHRH